MAAKAHGLTVGGDTSKSVVSYNYSLFHRLKVRAQPASTAVYGIVSTWYTETAFYTPPQWRANSQSERMLANQGVKYKQQQTIMAACLLRNQQTGGQNDRTKMGQNEYELQGDRAK